MGRRGRQRRRVIEIKRLEHSVDGTMAIWGAIEADWRRRFETDHLRCWSCTHGC